MFDSEVEFQSSNTAVAMISREQTLDWIRSDRFDLIRAHQNRLDWVYISGYIGLPEEWIRAFADRVRWELISTFRQRLSESFIREYQDQLSWVFVSALQKLSEPFIDEMRHRVDWSNVCMVQPLSEAFIRTHQNSVSWFNVSAFQKLSEPFIREFQHRVNWKMICMHQRLSDAFIREFQQRVDWGYLCNHQNLSESLIREFDQHVWWPALCTRGLLSDALIVDYQGSINLNKLPVPVSVSCLRKLDKSRMSSVRLFDHLRAHDRHLKFAQDWLVVYAMLRGQEVVSRDAFGMKL